MFTLLDGNQSNERQLLVRTVAGLTINDGWAKDNLLPIDDAGVRHKIASSP